jgi:hypothetical protein
MIQSAETKSRAMPRSDRLPRRPTKFDPASRSPEGKFETGPRPEIRYVVEWVPKIRVCTEWAQ